ncbi:hypothetical protein P261_02884 [Lachnospiraceae bacterium TWA4]|nr:hypothetical protein P261_02884 [Lachnospiraceae bacterium TWA4]
MSYRFKKLSDEQVASFCVIVARNTSLNILRKEKNIFMMEEYELEQLQEKRIGRNEGY